MLGRQRRKLVLDDCADHNGVEESRCGGSETSTRCLNLCHVSHDLALNVSRQLDGINFLRIVLGSAGIFTFAEASLVCSSHSKRDFFSLVVMGDRPVQRGHHPWFCFCGRHPRVNLVALSAIVGVPLWCLCGARPY
jgi:hypothetical protein